MKSLTSLIMDIYDQWDEQSWQTTGFETVYKKIFKCSCSQNAKKNNSKHS